MPYGDTLFQRLRAARREELEDLLPLLKIDPLAHKQATDEDLVSLLSREIRSAAGNSFRNATRQEHDFSYKQILVDVSNKLTKSKRKVNGPESEATIEDAIETAALELFRERLAKMSDSERRKVQEDAEREMRRKGVPSHVASGVSAFLGTGGLLGTVVASTVAPILFGSLWTWFFGYTLGQLFLAGLLGGGPIGVLVGAAAAASGPAYRKTIPVVLRLIAIRKNLEAEQAFATTEGSHAS